MVNSACVVELKYYPHRGRADPVAITFAALADKMDAKYVLKFTRVASPDLVEKYDASQAFCATSSLQIDGEAFEGKHDETMLQKAGTLTGSFPKQNSADRSRVLSILHIIDEVFDALKPSCLVDDMERKKIMREDLVQDVLPALLKKLETEIEKNEGDFCVGREISIADIAVYSMVRLGYITLIRLVFYEELT